MTKDDIEKAIVRGEGVKHIEVPRDLLREYVRLASHDSPPPDLIARIRADGQVVERGDEPYIKIGSALYIELLVAAKKGLPPVN